MEKNVKKNYDFHARVSRLHSNILYLLELLEDDKRHPLAVLINIIYLKVRQTHGIGYVIRDELCHHVLLRRIVSL